MVIPLLLIPLAAEPEMSPQDAMIRNAVRTLASLASLASLARLTRT